MKKEVKSDAKEEKMVKVRAIETGYFGFNRKYAGDVFSVPEKAFSEKWMEKADEKGKFKELPEEEEVSVSRARPASKQGLI